MNFVKLFFLLSFFIAAQLMAESAPFSVATAITPEMTTAGEDKAITTLKVQAVSEWLQGFLGARFPHFERAVDNEFADKYILNYSVNHPATQPPQLVVTGQIDADGLRKWIRIAENKSRSSSSPQRTLCLLSSSIPGQTFSPSETLSRSKDSVLATQLQHMVGPHLSKMGGGVIMAQSGAPNSSPPGAPHQFRDLKEYATKQGANLAVWVNIVPCPQCVGSRIEIFLYDIDGNRVAGVISEDLPIHARDTGNAELLKTQLAPLAAQFQTQVEKLISEGTLNAREYQLIVEEISSYRAQKGMEQHLQSQSFLSDPVLKRAASRVAEYRVLSSLQVDELVAKIQETEFQGRRLAASKIDSGSIVVQIR